MIVVLLHNNLVKLGIQYLTNYLKINIFEHELILHKNKIIITFIINSLFQSIN